MSNPLLRRAGAGYFLLLERWLILRRSRSLEHKLFFKEENGKEVSVESERVTTRREPVVTLTAPPRGNGWVTLNGLGAPSRHRLSFLPRGGKAVVPQRYAIDWVRLGADEKLFHDNPEVSMSDR